MPLLTATNATKVSESYRHLRPLLAYRPRFINLALLILLSYLATVTSAPTTQPQSSSSPPPTSTQQSNGQLATSTNSLPSQPTTTLTLSSVNPLTTTTNGVVATTLSQTTIPIISTTAIAATTTIPATTTSIATTTTNNPLENTTKTHSSGHSLQATPSETPNGDDKVNDTNGSLMLIVSLVVVFVVLASMGLVVYCLFRRRAFKRGLNLFGKGSNSGSSSPNGLNNISNDDLGTASSLRTSDMDLSRALQEMTEQHHGVLLSRKSSALSLGPNTHGQSAQAGNRILSPTLSAPRPYSQGTGYWTSPGSGLSIAGNRGSFTPGPMESSHDYRGSQYSAYRGSQYSDYYGAPATSQRPPYFNAMGGSLDFSSSDRLLLPNHHLYRTGSGNFNVGGRSSLSPGLCPNPESLQNPGPLSRAKTISTYSEHSNPASAYGVPHHSHPYPYYRHPPGQSIHTVSNTCTAESSSDDIRESDNSRSTSEPQVSAATAAGCDDANESAQSLNSGVSPNIEIPPSITTRRRSVEAISYHTSQDQSSNFQQQEEQQQQNIPSSSQEQSTLSSHPVTHPNQTEAVAHKAVTKNGKAEFGSGSGEVGPEDGGKTEISYDTEAPI